VIPTDKKHEPNCSEHFTNLTCSSFVFECNIDLKFEVFTAVKIQFVVFWVFAPFKIEATRSSEKMISIRVVTSQKTTKFNFNLLLSFPYI
jgi:hypothetical protein